MMRRRKPPMPRARTKVDTAVSRRAREYNHPIPSSRNELVDSSRGAPIREGVEPVDSDGDSSRFSP